MVSYKASTFRYRLQDNWITALATWFLYSDLLPVFLAGCSKPLQQELYLNHISHWLNHRYIPTYLPSNWARNGMFPGCWVNWRLLHSWLGESNCLVPDWTDFERLPLSPGRFRTHGQTQALLWSLSFGVCHSAHVWWLNPFGCSSAQFCWSKWYWSALMWVCHQTVYPKDDVFRTHSHACWCETNTHANLPPFVIQGDAP